MERNTVFDITPIFKSIFKNRGPSKIHFVLTYKTIINDGEELQEEETEPRNLLADKNSKKVLLRENYLHNLRTNGLKLEELKDCDDPDCDEDNEERCDTRKKKVNFVLVETPTEVFFDIAEKMRLKLPIDKNDLHVSKIHERLNCLTPDEIKTEKGRKYFTAPYEAKYHDKFQKFLDENSDPDILPDKFFIEVTHEILTRTTFSRELTKPELFDDNDNDKQIGIHLLIAKGIFSSCYPVHEEYGKECGKTTRQLLWDHWAKPCSLTIGQPLHLLRMYFGEKLAFYFAWLGVYTSWLIFPAVAGLLVIAFGYVTMDYDTPTREICDRNSEIGGTIMCPLCYYQESCKTWELRDTCVYSKFTYLIDNYATVLFSVFISIWNIMFIAFWRREQHKLQFEWDTVNYSRNETIRPEFEIQTKRKRENPITKKTEPYIPLFEKINRYSLSVATTAFVMCLVLAAVLGIIVYRVSLRIVLSKSDTLRHYSVYIVTVSAGLINLIAILALKHFYRWLAVKLTNLESHKYNSNYENSLTIKMYLFQFINYYSAVFYIAFIKGRYRFILDYIEPCEQSGCLTELYINLAIIMSVGILFGNVKEVLKPVIKIVYRHGFVKKIHSADETTIRQIFKKLKDYTGIRNNADLKRCEIDYRLNNWTNWTIFDEYLEIVIQYGFISMFIVAFPLGPLLALLSNLIEIRLDAFKCLKLFRRPLTSRAKDIGIWIPILSNLSKIGIIVSGSIIAFTSDFIPRMVYSSQTGSLEGYVESTLSTKYISNVTNKFERKALIAMNITECKYRDFSEQTHLDDSHYSVYDYQVLLARIVFLFVYEHFVFFLVAVVERSIKRMPGYIEDQIKREQFIIQRTNWSTESQFAKIFPKLPEA